MVVMPCWVVYCIFDYPRLIISLTTCIRGTVEYSDRTKGMHVGERPGVPRSTTMTMIATLIFYSYRTDPNRSRETGTDLHFGMLQCAGFMDRRS